MAGRVDILPIRDLPLDFDRLRAAAAEEGFGFLERLGREWESGENRFDRPGERLSGAFTDSRLIAIAGLNRDPYTADPAIGRLRHLYVSKGARGDGVGRRLVEHLLGHARGVFSQVRLRTDTDEASAFYLRCGFAAVEDGAASHLIGL